MAFQGSLKELPLPDIVQLVSVSGKTGVFSLRNGALSGEIYLRDGQIVHASSGGLEGEEAVYELAVWAEGDFVFHPGKASPATTIKRSNTNLLMEAARRLDEWQVLSKRIPSTRLVPVFTPQTKKTSISLTPAEWSLIARIDERRSIEEVALALGESPFEAAKLLYGLITSGLVALTEGFHRAAGDRIHRLSNEEAGALLDRIAEVARSYAGEAVAGIEAALRMSRAELNAGRRTDAVVDLIRASEKVVGAEAGEEKARAFVGRAADLLTGS